MVNICLYMFFNTKKAVGLVRYGVVFFFSLFFFFFFLLS